MTTPRISIFFIYIHNFVDLPSFTLTSLNHDFGQTMSCFSLPLKYTVCRHNVDGRPTSRPIHFRPTTFRPKIFVQSISSNGSNGLDEKALDENWDHASRQLISAIVYFQIERKISVLIIYL